MIRVWSSIEDVERKITERLFICGKNAGSCDIFLLSIRWVPIGSDGFRIVDVLVRSSVII